MEYLETVSVPVIAAIVMVVMSLMKAALKNTKGLETFKQFIPLTSAILGAALGIAAFYTAPDLIAAQNVFVAMVSGGASGLAATGCHQIFKQMKPDGSQTAKPDDSIAGAGDAADEQTDESSVQDALEEVVKLITKDKDDQK